MAEAVQCYPGEKVVLDVIQNKFWTQHVDFPTHEDGNILDIALGSPGLVAGVSDEGRLGTSDHNMFKLDIVGPALERDSVELVPDWAKADMEGLRTAILEINWVERLEGKTGLKAWDILKRVIQEETDRCVPLKRRRTSSRPLWMNKNILRLIRKKRRLWKAYTREEGPLPGRPGNRDSASFVAYRNVQNEVQKSIKRAKRKVERKLAKDRKGKSKSFFSYIKKKTSNRVSVGPLKVEDEVVADSTKMASILNTWYCSMFTEEDTSNMPEAENLCKVGQELDSVEFTAEKVEKKLKKLRPTAAPGPDKIWARVAHDLATELSIPLAMVYSKCMDEGVVPEEWKWANVTPIYKKGSKGLPGNYRPVSLTCILCKVMESVIRDSIVEHLTSKSLLRQSQHGFMRGKSTVTNLLEYLEELTMAIDRGEDVDVLYLDFSKAFDKVPIRRLLSKCEGLGIKGKLLGWVEQWLTGRRQRVVLNGKESEWGPIKSGVVQGSVLGPCLFLIFINDIDQAVEGVGGMLKNFADDTKWGKKVMREEERMAFQQGIDNLHRWSSEWQMPFNEDKCHVLHVGRTNSRFQ